MTDLGDYSVVADNLTKYFGTFIAVDHISFAVPHGEIFGFLGPNGAGKTTTIRMLLGLLRPSAGTAHVLGHDVGRDNHAVQALVGYMGQRFGLYGDLTVAENLSFYGRTYGVEGDRLRERQRAALELNRLQGREDTLARDLSGGFRQRLALACATLHDPRLLFLDEPTAGVDPISRRAFWDYLYDLSEAGRTIFVTTHYMDEAENCRRLAFIDGGKILIQGSPSEIKDQMPQEVLEIDAEQPDLALTSLRQAADDGRLAVHELALYGSQIHAAVDDADAVRPVIAAVLAAAGVPVRSLDRIAPSLEDVFIAVVRGGQQKVMP